MREAALPACNRWYHRGLLPVLQGNDDMNEHQADQGHRQGHVHAQPTMQPSVHLDLQIVLPSLLAKAFQGVDDSAGLRAEIAAQTAKESRRPQLAIAKAILTCDPRANTDRPSSRNYRRSISRIESTARRGNLGLEDLASNAAHGPHGAHGDKGLHRFGFLQPRPQRLLFADRLRRRWLRSSPRHSNTTARQRSRFANKSSRPARCSSIIRGRNCCKDQAEDAADNDDCRKESSAANLIGRPS